MSSIPELTRSASLIFTGTVVELGASSVPILPASENLAVVRVDRGLRSDPVLGDLKDQKITMATAAPKTLTLGQKAVFFTNSWIHGRGIAVREVEHLDLGEENNVAAAVARLPELHLLERLQSAQMVVDAEVVRISPLEITRRERNAAVWAAAQLRVENTLRGQAGQSMVVYFPTVDRPPWRSAPRFKERQRGIFLLHAPSRSGTLSETTLKPGSLVALDPADFQPESQLPQVKKLLASLGSEGGVR